MSKLIKRVAGIAVIFTMVLEQSGFAQVAPQMHMPAYINGYVAADRFRPMQLRSMEFDQIKGDCRLLLDQGDALRVEDRQVRRSAQELMDYFQVGLALPDSSFWVNLRPDAPDRVIDPYLEKTEAGRILLEADLQLKKDLARFTAPNSPEGKKYWEQLYARAEILFGGEEMVIPSMTRPWIVPQEILLTQTASGAHIFKATLQVKLEQDWLKAGDGRNEDPRLTELNEFSSELIRREILPRLTREVNSSKRYAALRQVYFSLILAQWFKQRFRGVTGNGAVAQYARRIDSRNLDGLQSPVAWDTQRYFKEYRKSF